MAPAVDLADLVLRLRSAGFRVDTRQYLTAHELLLAYAARGRPLDDSAALASHLGPVFCSQPEEQQRFAHEVAAWRDGVPPRTPPAIAQPTQAPVRWRPWHRAFAALALIAALAAGAGWLLYREYRAVTIHGSVIVDAGSGSTRPAPAAKVVFRGTAVDVDAQGRFHLVTRRADGDGSLEVELPAYTPLVRNVDAFTPSPLALTLRPRPRHVVVDPSSPIAIGERRDVVLGALKRYTLTGALPWPWIAGGSLATAALLLALLVGGDVNRRRLALQRLEAIGDPEELTLSPPARDAVRTAEHDLRRIASALRRPQLQPVTDLDARASVESTARAGGPFTPVYVARRAMPEYLVLVQRRSADDHWSQWVSAWIDRLAANGVHAERFSFDADPRTCHADDEKRRPHRLTDLVARRHRSTLLVFAETEACFDRLHPTPHDWIDVVRPLPRRVLFTPEPPFRWTRREWQLATEGFVVLPAGEEGLRAFATLAGEWRIEQCFPARYARDYPRLLAGEAQRWIDRNAPPDATVETLLRQLRGYLGPEGFAWLCACAAYPQLSWPLTLHLGALPVLGADALAALPSLARLPWMRYGFMPDWLRHRLLGELSPEQDAGVREALEAMLGRLALAAPDAGPAAAKAIPGALKIARWVAPLDVMRAAPPASPLRDRVFLGFVAGESRDRLLLRVKDDLTGGFRKREFDALPAATGEPSSFVARANRSAEQGREFARRLATRARAWLALHPWQGAAMTSLAAGAIAFAALRAMLPESPVDVLQRASFLAFTPDGASIVTRSPAGNTVLVDSATLRVRELDDYGAWATSAAVAPGGDTLAIGYADGRVRRWRRPASPLETLFDLPGSSPVADLGYADDGTMLAASTRALARWNEATQRVARRPLPAANEAIAVTIARDARYFGALGQDGALRIVDAADGRVSRTVRCGTTAPPALGPDGAIACAGFAVGTLRLPGSGKGDLVSPLHEGAFAIASIAFSPDGSIVATGASDGLVDVWNAHDGTLLVAEPLRAGDGPVEVVRFDDGGTRLAAVVQGRLAIWPIEAKAPVQQQAPNAQPRQRRLPAQQESPQQAPPIPQSPIQRQLPAQAS